MKDDAALTGPAPGAPAFDETGPPGECLPQYELIKRWLDETPRDAVDLKRREAELLFRRIGITFAVYAEGGSPERLIPFDIIPRVLAPAEWNILQRGLTQRVKALNAFIRDVYHDREILHAGRLFLQFRIVLNCYRPPPRQGQIAQRFDRAPLRPRDLEPMRLVSVRVPIVGSTGAEFA